MHKSRLVKMRGKVGESSARVLDEIRRSCQGLTSIRGWEKMSKLIQLWKKITKNSPIIPMHDHCHAFIKSALPKYILTPHPFPAPLSKQLL